MSETHAAPVDDEPKTPMWLPALGAALFVAAGLWWAVAPSAPAGATEPAPSASAAAAAASAPVAGVGGPAARPTPPTGANSAHTVTVPNGASSALQDRLNQMRQRLQNRGAGGQH